MISLEKRYASAVGISAIGAATSFLSILIYGAISDVSLMAQILFIIGFIELFCSLTNFGITQYIHRYHHTKDSTRIALTIKIPLSLLATLPVALYLTSTSIISGDNASIAIVLPTLILHSLSRLYADIQESKSSFISAQLIRATPSIFRLFGALAMLLNSELRNLQFFSLVELLPVVGSTIYGALNNALNIKEFGKVPKEAARYMVSYYANDIVVIPVNPSFIRVLASSFLPNSSFVILGIVQTFLYPIARFSPPTLMKGSIIRELSNKHNADLIEAKTRISRQTNVFSAISSIAALSVLTIYYWTTKQNISQAIILTAIVGCASMWVTSIKMLKEVFAQVHEQQFDIVKSSFVSTVFGILFCGLCLIFDVLWIAVGGFAAIVWMLCFYMLSKQQRDL